MSPDLPAPSPSGPSSSRPLTPTAAASTLSLKRPLSSPAPTPSAPKRANSEDLMSSDHEGSIGASRLNLASTPDRTPATGDDPDSTLTAPPSAPLTPPGDNDLPPAYGDQARDEQDEGEEDADAQGEDDDHLPTWQQASASSYNGIAPQNQLMMVEDVKNSPLEAGDSWYLVSRAWYRRWQTACSGVAASKDVDDELTPEMVGPIDNSSLVAEDGVSLRKPLTVGVDVEVLPVPAWRYLCDWCVSR